jgi:hypothetical protein
MFKVKGSTAYVEFPYQTPTTLTYAVIGEKDVEKRIQLIKDDLNKCINKDANKWIIKQCETLMRDDKLELTYM